MNHKDLQGNTPLCSATIKGHTATVEVLLQGNANPDISGKFDRMPLTWAASYGHYDLVDLVHRHNVDVGARDTFDVTPLSLAASMGHCGIVKLLLRRTSNADSIDDYGRTPLSYACKGGYKEIVEEFLKRSDVDVNSGDIYGKSVLSWAIEGYRSFYSCFEYYKNVVDMLLSRHDILVDEADKEALEKFQSEVMRKEAVSYVPMACNFGSDDGNDVLPRPIEERNWVIEGTEDCNMGDWEDMSE